MCAVFALRHLGRVPVQFGKPDHVGRLQIQALAGCPNRADEQAAGRVGLKPLHGVVTVGLGRCAGQQHGLFLECGVERVQNVQVMREYDYLVGLV